MGESGLIMSGFFLFSRLTAANSKGDSSSLINSSSEISRGFPNNTLFRNPESGNVRDEVFNFEDWIINEGVG